MSKDKVQISMLKLPANGNQAESPKLKDAGDAIKRAQEQLSSLGDLLDIPSPGRAKTEAQALLIIDNPSFAPEPSPRDQVTPRGKVSTAQTPVTSPSRGSTSSSLPGSARKAVANEYPRSFPVTSDVAVSPASGGLAGWMRRNRQLQNTLRTGGSPAPHPIAGLSTFPKSSAWTPWKIIQAIIWSSLLLVVLANFLTVGPGGAFLAGYGIKLGFPPTYTPPKTSKTAAFFNLFKKSPPPKPSLFAKLLPDTVVNVATKAAAAPTKKPMVEKPKPAAVPAAPKPVVVEKKKPAAPVPAPIVKKKTPAVVTKKPQVPVAKPQPKPVVKKAAPPPKPVARGKTTATALRNPLTALKALLTAVTAPITKSFIAVFGTTKTGILAVIGVLAGLTGAVLHGAAPAVVATTAAFGTPSPRRGRAGRSGKATPRSRSTTPARARSTSRPAAKGRGGKSSTKKAAADVDGEYAPRSAPRSSKRLVSAADKKTPRKWNRV